MGVQKDESLPGGHAAAGGEMYRAGHPVLGARLLSAANLVAGRVVADVGCDHGKLAVWLAARGKAQKVIAVDSRPMPLAKAKALVRQFGLQGKVECRLGDGLGALAPGEADCIVVAGLSSETICAIIDGAPWVRTEGVSFVLVPATRPERLRRWLCENGFALEEERAAKEQGRVYAVMKARFAGGNGAKPQPTPLFCEMGLLPAFARQGGAEAMAAVAQYRDKRLLDLRMQLNAPLAEGERQALLELIREVETCLQ